MGVECREGEGARCHQGQTDAETEGRLANLQGVVALEKERHADNEQWLQDC